MFISGLPNRLSDEEFNKCIKNYKETGSEEDREKIINHNLRLVGYIVSKDFELLNLDKDDLFSIGVIGLIKAVDNFDISKGFAFATFATICIRNEILMYFRREKKRLSDLSIQSLISDKDGKEAPYDCFIADESLEFEDDVADHDIFLYVCDEIENLNERERTIIKSFFGIGREKINQCTIAEELNLSQSYVSRVIKKCITTLRDKLIFEMNNSYSLLRKK